MYQVINYIPLSSEVTFTSSSTSQDYILYNQSALTSGLSYASSLAFPIFTPSNQLQKSVFIEKLLSFIAENELWDVLYWTSDLRFSFNCNDVFYWGASDAENIDNEDDIALLQKCITDIEAIDSADRDNDIVLLYCCRRRKSRPQGAMYKHVDKKLWPLIDECGPEREAGVGNPEDKPKI